MPDLVGIPGPDVEGFRPLLRPHLEAMAAASRGRATAVSIFDAVERGDVQLWLVVENHRPRADIEIVAAGLTELIRYPNHNACRWIALVGREAKLWLRKHADVEAWARAEGCTEMQALVGQKGWERLLGFVGYRPDHVLLSKAL